MNDPHPSTSEQTVDLLQKLLVFKLHEMCVKRERIADLVGRPQEWVDDLLHDVHR